MGVGASVWGASARWKPCDLGGGLCATGRRMRNDSGGGGGGGDGDGEGEGWYGCGLTSLRSSRAGSTVPSTRESLRREVCAVSEDGGRGRGRTPFHQQGRWQGECGAARVGGTKVVKRGECWRPVDTPTPLSRYNPAVGISVSLGDQSGAPFPTQTAFKCWRGLGEPGSGSSTRVLPPEPERAE